MSDEDPPKPRIKWTQTAVIVMVILLAVVLFLILSIETMGKGQLRRQAVCAQHMSQLMGALIAYSSEAEVAWPTYVGMPKRDVMSAHEARRVTCQMFAMLAKHQSIHLSIFSCPQAGRPPPSKITGSDVPRDWGMSDAGVLAYAFDWASPSDPSASRVIIADRDPLAHGTSVMACFGDAHVKKLKHAPMLSARGPEALVTEGIDGKPIAVSVGNPEAGGDDIYSPDGDGGDPLTSDKGDPLRAWVK